MRSTAITGSPMCAMRRPVMHSRTCRRAKFTVPFRRYPDFMERCMKRPIGLPRLYLASSVSEKTLVAKSEERLHSVLTTLEQCRAVLAETTNRETVQLLSVAILQLRMKLNQVADSELKALCDAMVPDDGTAEGSEDPKSQDQRRRALLKLVK